MTQKAWASGLPRRFLNVVRNACWLASIRERSSRSRAAQSGLSRHVERMTNGRWTYKLSVVHRRYGYVIRKTGLLSCPFQMFGKRGSIFLVINRIKRLCDPIFEEGDVLSCAVRFPLMMFRLAGHGLLELTCQSRPKAIGQDSPSCGQQGGFTLMATFRTPNTRPADEAKGFRLGTSGRIVSRLLA